LQFIELHEGKRPGVSFESASIVYARATMVARSESRTICVARSS
jgi:hypothetical protein